MDPLIRSMLVCPKCKGELQGEDIFVCNACRLVFHPLYGIPNLLIDEAEQT